MINKILCSINFVGKKSPGGHAKIHKNVLNFYDHCCLLSQLLKIPYQLIEKTKRFYVYQQKNNASQVLTGVFLDSKSRINFIKWFFCVLLS